MHTAERAGNDYHGPDTVDGARLGEMLHHASASLEANAAAVDAINVFPVPDGDTGSNMALTLKAAVEAADRASVGGAPVIADVAREMARGALMGARGNSGVILSQILRGLAAGLDGHVDASPSDLARALRSARDAGYASVPQPVEGTILTVVDAAAGAAERHAASADASPGSLLGAVVDASQDAVERTPSLLRVLAEAGVVDAGGQGLLVIFEGFRRALAGEPPLAAPAGAAETRPAETIAHEEGDFYGYCTEILLSGEGLSREEALEEAGRLGRSVLVVGDETMLRIHVHTEDPGAVLTYGTARGQLLSVKVDNMEEQYRAWAASQRRPPEPQPPDEVGTGWRVMAVTSGDGLAEVLRSLGAAHIVAGGQTNNPSAEELLAGIRATGGEGVFVLPNNKNILLAARQAATLTETPVRVIPARTLPQGVAALLAYSPEGPPESNEAAMTRAIAGVRTIEVTRAVRPAKIKRLKVEQGQFIAIIDGELEVAEASPEEAGLSALRRTASEGAEVITVYAGAGVTREQVNGFRARIAAGFPGVEVEVVRGGQPLYPYIISVE